MIFFIIRKIPKFEKEKPKFLTTFQSEEDKDK